MTFENSNTSRASRWALGVTSVAYCWTNINANMQIERERESENERGHKNVHRGQV